MGYGSDRRGDRGGQQEAPPKPSGVVVREFERPGFRDKPDAKLVVCADEFNGHGFVSIRLWEAGRDGIYRPTKKGVTVRPGEACQFATAVVEALDLCGGAPPASGGKAPARPSPHPDRPGYVPPRGSRSGDADRMIPPWEETAGSLRPADPSFDEFAAEGGAR